MAVDYKTLVGQVAGVLSTFPPHDHEHPESCMPMAQAAVAVMLDLLNGLPPVDGSAS